MPKLKPTRRITVRQSFNKKNSYTLIFFDENFKRVGMFETKNGSIVDLGKVIMNYIKDNSIPANIV